MLKQSVKKAVHGFPRRNAAHALAVATVKSVEKDKLKGKIVLTAGAHKRLADIRAQASVKDKTKSKAKNVKVLPQSKSSETTVEGKKPHKFKPGTVALRKIRKYQKSFKLLLPFLPFARLCHEIGADNSILGRDLQWNSSAILALQEATEAYCIGFMEDAQLSAINSKRITVMARDIWLVKKLRLSVD